MYKIIIIVIVLCSFEKLYGNDFSYEYIDNGNAVRITKYSGKNDVVIIPENIDNLPVTEIGHQAFNGCVSMKNIIIPDSVTIIRNSAFSRCFNLLNITIPKSVTFIEEWAFLFCESLTSITIPEGVTSIERYTFANCINLLNISLPNSIISIRDNAFNNCKNLLKITLPNSVIFIGEYAFTFCTSLKTIKIPENIISIGNNAFSRCDSLVEFFVEEANENFSSSGGVLFNKDKTILIQFPIGKEEQSYVIPIGVITIGNYAFSFSKLTNIYLPVSIILIEERAFNGSFFLTNINIPESVIYIGRHAFMACHKLKSIIISRHTDINKEDFPNNIRIIYND